MFIEPESSIRKTVSKVPRKKYGSSGVCARGTDRVALGALDAPDAADRGGDHALGLNVEGEATAVSEVGE